MIQDKLRAFSDAEWRHIETTVQPFDPEDFSEPPLDHWTAYLDHDINIVGKYTDGSWVAHAFAYPLIKINGTFEMDTANEIDLGVLGLINVAQTRYVVKASYSEVFEVDATDKNEAMRKAFDLIDPFNIRLKVKVKK